MDNDVLQDNNGNVVTPDNNEVLDNEVEGGVSSGIVSPGTGPGTGGIDPVGPTWEQPEPVDPPWQPDPNPGTNPEEPEEPGSGSVPVLISDQKIPTNDEIRDVINDKAGAWPDDPGYYGWTGPQTGYYCPTRDELRSNIKNKAKIDYTTIGDLSDDQCPTTKELLGAITIKGSIIH
jgi:hypothetical protein